MTTSALVARPARAPLRSPRRRVSARTRRRLIYPLALAALSFAVYRQGFQHSFTNWDDSQYIVDNPLVHGFSMERIEEAFTSFTLFNYNPLHLVSYMLDYEVWGLRPGGYFFTSLLLHTATGILIYFFAARWLRSPSAAWLVAALFLLHPTRIESVAWLSERKDVLSGAFGAAAMLVWSSRLDTRAAAPGGPGKAAAAWVLFLLALLSKSQLVSLPVVLLFMDLARSRPLYPSLRAISPFVALSVLFCAITLRAHTGEASLGISFPESITGPLAALPRYVLHIVLPVALSPYYDYMPGEFRAVPWVAAGAALAALCLAGFAYAWRRDREHCLHIAWFLAFLAPVIGFFRIRILLADRYLYLAILGPLLAMAYLSTRRGRLRRPALIGGLGAVLACALLSASYAEVFRDSEALWRCVLQACPESSIAHSNLGHYLLGRGRVAEAAEHYDRDLAALPIYETTILGRALIHEDAGSTAEARRLYALALEKRPLSPRVRLQFSDFLEKSGEPAEAHGLLAGLDPSLRNGDLERKISDLERRAGKTEEARASALRAIALSPADPRNRHMLGLAEEARGDTGAALRAYQEALRLDPDFFPSLGAVERMRADSALRGSAPAPPAPPGR